MTTNGYELRTVALKSLGFSSYKDHQDSFLWADIRLRILKQAGWRCSICKLPAKTVHHSEYTVDNLSGSSDRGLHALCHQCHREVEVDGEGNKRSWEESCKSFIRMKKGKFRIRIEKRKGRKNLKGGKPQIGLAYKRRAIARRKGR